MKTYIQLLILLPVLMSALATLAASPTLARVKPGNSEVETITIVKGQSITFEVQGTDADSDISGIDWYKNSFLGTDTYSSSGNVTMTKNIIFSAAGEYNISCKAFDAATAKNYSNEIKWKVNVIEHRRSMYVNWAAGIFGVPRAEESLLKLARDNKITGVHIYYFNVNKENSHHWDAFFGRLRANGVTYISVVLTDDYDWGDEMLAFYDDPAVTNKFDGIITEIEFWWGDGTRASRFKKYYDILTFLSNASIARNKGFKVESYASEILDQAEANKICDKVDRVLLSYYFDKISSSDVYWDSNPRGSLQLLCNAPNAGNLTIRPLFSKETIYMHNYTYDQIDASFFDGFNGDNTLVNKYKPTIEGSAYFTYTEMSDGLIGPHMMGFSPGYSRTDTLYIAKNDSLEFTISGEDYNKNLKGVEWYKDNVLQYTDTGELTEKKTFKRTFHFNEAGTFEIYGNLFDADNLYLAERRIQKRMVQVTDPSKNIARNKKVWQSTTVYGGQAERAIDGNIASAWAGGSITHTDENDNDTQAWWTIDLSENTHVRFMKIYNRTDACCKNRLSDFYVFASKNVLTRPGVEATKDQANVISRHFSTEAGKGLNIKLDAEVRYIRIQLNTAGGALNLAEVEVYAKEVKTPPPPTPPAPAPTPTPEPTPTPPDPTPTPDPTPPVTGLGQNGNNVKNEPPTLYPNPASDKIMLSMPEAVKFEIVNAMGSRVDVPYTRENEMITFDIRQLSPGIYLVLAIEKNNRVKKVLKFIRR